MPKQILNYINKYETIIIHRHKRPDMDAIGSQMGLYHLIKENFPTKEVYVVGDSNDFMYEAVMDEIDDSVYNDSLAIITDVAVSYLVSDDRYTLASDLVIIDHHKNDTDIENVSYFHHLNTYTSAAQIIVDLAMELELSVNSDAATFLYAGMVTDTGRFNYISNDNASRVFASASYITKFNPRITEIYDYLYTEDLDKRVTKDMFRSFEVTPNNVAYRKNTQAIIDKSKLTIFNVSRGMVNLMAGIKEIPIWVSFTEDSENNVILAEIRSRGITVVDIAKKYGGGGHNNACGASLKDFNEADEMLKDLDERAKEHGNIK